MAPNCGNHNSSLSCIPELPDMTPNLMDVVEPTEHEIHCQSLVSGWKDIRECVQAVVTENAALSEGQVCIFCGKLASLRCQQCGPLGFFCSQCFTKVHDEINLFHVADKWEV